jgi:hypothetical protein
MMLKMKTISILAIAGLVLALASTAQAAIIAPIGYDGPYKLLYVTTLTSGATSQDIGVYNAVVVADVANEAELTALGATWSCLGSTGNGATSIVDARDNTNTNPNVETGVPLYTTSGLRIADDNANLWNGTGNIQNPITKADGTAAEHPNIWTGTYFADGTADWRPWQGSLGNPEQNYITQGLANDTTSQWSGNQRPWTEIKFLYGMSSVIPEPATMSLLAIGGIALIRRRRRA